MAAPESHSRALNQSLLRDPRVRRQVQRCLQIYRGAMRTRMVASGSAKRSLQSVKVDELDEGEHCRCIDDPWE